MHKFDQTATDTRLHFFGNVQVGPRSLRRSHTQLEISLSSLTLLLFSIGCTVLLPSLDLSCIIIRPRHPALSLVYWYTQHPSRPAPRALHKRSMSPSSARPTSRSTSHGCCSCPRRVRLFPPFPCSSPIHYRTVWPAPSV
jgi:hypothetical protein